MSRLSGDANYLAALELGRKLMQPFGENPPIPPARTNAACFARVPQDFSPFP
jgi:hypothetical protein